MFILKPKISMSSFKFVSFDNNKKINILLEQNFFKEIFQIVVSCHGVCSDIVVGQISL
jgi:hypothetical protein